MEKNIIELIANSLTYIEDNLKNSVTLKDIAQQACMSVSLYSRLFRSIFGISAKDYVIKRKLTLAAKELVFTSESITSIALKYGYSGYEQFSRLFKRVYHLSPREYRKRGIYLETFPKSSLSIISKGGSFMCNFDGSKFKDALSNSEYSLAMGIDIDYFGRVNEQYGRKAGDVVLVTIQERIKEVMNELNISGEVFRTGADEFVVLTNIGKDLAMQFAKKIIEDYR
uniref:Helix-turn-helix domain-containing protein n=1 Tax=Fervidobacterium pennivorans TaxID=93466 RepID=A0A7C4W4I0_FERPE